MNWEKTNPTVVPEEIIHKMLALAFPTEVTSYEVIEGGCANINIKIHLSSHSKPAILRIYLRDKSAAYREQKLGLLLKDIIPVPYLHYIGEIDDYRFAIVDYLPGKPLRDLLIENPSSITLYQLMYETGRILSKISSFELVEAGFFDDDLNVISGSATNKHLMDHAQECLRSPTVKAVFKLEIIAEIEAFFIKFSNLFPDPNARNLVHGDFDPTNILVAKIDGGFQISGILDWEFAFAGSVLWDVSNMLRYAHKMPCEFKDAFIKGLTEQGVILPNNWQATIKLLNLMSLLDCLKRADVDRKPNQCADIFNLIQYILQSLT